MENRRDEFDELRSRAIQRLENPSLLPNSDNLKHFRPVLRLWNYPAFGNDTAWVFYKPLPQVNSQAPALIKKAVWNKKADQERFLQPMTGLKEGFHLTPTFDTASAEIDRPILSGLCESLSKIVIPPFVEDERIGVDGEHFGIETLGAFHSAKISWWSTFPEEWKEINQWFEITVKFAEEQFRSR